MKKCFMLLVLVFFISCSKNDTDTTDSILVGSWKLTSLTIENPIIVDGESTSDFTEFALDSEINFTNDTAGSISYLSGLSFFSQTINLIVQYSSTSSFSSFNFQFEKNNDEITVFKDNNETIVLTLNDNTLTMVVTSGVVNVNLDTNSSQNYTAKYIFTRQ